MHTSPSSVRRLLARLLLWLPLLGLVLGGDPPASEAAGETLTLKKRMAGTTDPMPTGKGFWYHLDYTWGTISGSSPHLVIEDTLPAAVELDLPNVPTFPPGGSYTAATSGGVTTVSFDIDVGSQPSGGTGTVGIPVRLKTGALCTSVEYACNTQAWIAVADAAGHPIATTKTNLNLSDPLFPMACVRPTATNQWTFALKAQSGCACDQPVRFELAITTPVGGNIGGLDLIDPKIVVTVPAPATLTGVVNVATWPASLAWANTGVVPSGMVTGANTSSETVDFTGVTLPAVNGKTSFVYFEAVFPCSAFQTGSPQFGLTLTYATPCGPAPEVKLQTTLVMCPAVTGASVGKELWFSREPGVPPSVVPASLCPGCCAWYRLYYGNNGTVPIVNPTITDTLPAGLDVTEIVTDTSLGATVTAFDSGGTQVFTQAYGATPGTASATVGPNSGIAKVVWKHTGSLPVGRSLVHWLSVCNTSAALGSTVTNLLEGDHAQPKPLPTTIDPCGPRLFVRKDFMGSTCGDTTWQSPVPAGSKVRFRLTIANVGNAAATGVVVKDHLPPGVTYAGNETYHFGAVSHLGLNQHALGTCAGFQPLPPVEVGALAPGTPDTSSPQNVSWTIPTLPGRCRGVLEGLQIEFDALLDATMDPGTYVNTFDAVLAGAIVPSNDASFTISGVPQWRARKWVRVKGTTTWSKSVTASPGTQLEYLLQVHNASTVPVHDICLLDVMPHFGDVEVLPFPLQGGTYKPRTSDFGLPVDAGAIPLVQVVNGDSSTGTATLVASPGADVQWFSPASLGKNPRRSGSCLAACTPISDPSGASAGTWTPGNAPAPAGAFAFQVVAPSSLTLQPGQSLEVIVPTTVPAGATGHACNNVAAKATGNGPCQVAQTLDPVCVIVKDLPTPACFELVTKTVTCDPHGGFLWTFALTNLSGGPVNQVKFPVGGPLTFQPALLPIGPIAANGTATGSVTISGVGATPGATVCFDLSLAFGNPAVVADTICTKEVCVALPECAKAACDQPECRVDSVSISTGVDPVTGSVLSSGSADPGWLLVLAPPTPATVPLQNAWVIPAIPSWDSLPNSGWISAFNVPGFNPNNMPPANPYTFQRCFCVCEGVKKLSIDFDMHVDNLADVVHVAPGGVRTTIPNTWADITTQAFINPPAHVHHDVLNPAPGQHCIEIELRNKSAVAMGVNIAGSVTASPAGAPLMLSHACCHPAGRIVGVKYNDLGCDGVVDGSDVGVAGFTFTATNGTSTYASTAPSDVTGAFYFPPLPPGTYTVTEDPRVGWTQTAPAGGGSHTVTVTAGGVAQVFFANCDPCETLLSGGPRDGCCGYVATIDPVAGWSVEHVDYAVVGGTMQSVSVNYPFATSPALPAAAGTVTLTPESPAGLPVVVTMVAENTAGGCEVCVDLTITIVRPFATGQLDGFETRTCTKRQVCFPCCRKGETSSSGALCVFKYDDRKPFGDPTGDAGIAGVTFTVKDGVGNTVATGTTNASGHVCFALAPGTYTVLETVPTGWTATTTNPRIVVVSAGSPAVLEFGNRRREGGFDLEVVKTMEPNPLVPGGPATATITVVNLGPDPCPGPIVLTDAFTPNGILTLNSTFVTMGMNGGWTQSGATWTHPGPLAANDPATFTYQFTVSPRAEKPVTNCARVEVKGDRNPKNNESCVTLDVERPGRADLEIRKSMEKAARPSGAWLATITLVNKGPAPCPGPIVVKDLLTPAGALVPLSGSATPAASWSYANGTFTFTGTALAVGVPQTFTVLFQPAPGFPGGVVTNCAVVEASSDSNPRNNRSCVEVVVRNGGESDKFDLVVRKEMDPRPLVPGQPATATITVVNLGPASCPAPILLKDVWTPAGALTVTSIVASHPSNWSVNLATAEATFTGAFLPANQPQTFTYTFLVARDAEGVVTNCATVAAAGDINPRNNRSCVERPVAKGPGGRADLRIGKRMSSPTLVPGGTATATIQVVNAGPSPCPGPIAVADVWSPTNALTLVSITPSHPMVWSVNVATGTCTFTGTALPVNQPHTFTYVFQVSVKGASGGEMRNCARVTSPNDSDPTNNEACVVATIRRKGPEVPGEDAGAGSMRPIRFAARGENMEPLTGSLAAFVLVGSDGTTIDLARRGAVVRIGDLTLPTSQIVAVRFRWQRATTVSAILVTSDGRSIPYPAGRDANLRSIELRPAGEGRGYRWSEGTTARQLMTSAEMQQ